MQSIVSRIERLERLCKLGGKTKSDGNDDLVDSVKRARVDELIKAIDHMDIQDIKELRDKVHGRDDSSDDEPAKKPKQNHDYKGSRQKVHGRDDSSDDEPAKKPKQNHDFKGSRQKVHGRDDSSGDDEGGKRVKLAYMMQTAGQTTGFDQSDFAFLEQVRENWLRINMLPFDAHSNTFGYDLVKDGERMLRLTVTPTRIFVRMYGWDGAAFRRGTSGFYMASRIDTVVDIIARWKRYEFSGAQHVSRNEQCAREIFDAVAEQETGLDLS